MNTERTMGGKELWAVSGEAGGERAIVVHQLDCGRVLSAMKYRAISRDLLQWRCQTTDSCDWIMDHVSTLSHMSLFNHLQARTSVSCNRALFSGENLNISFPEHFSIFSLTNPPFATELQTFTRFRDLIRLVTRLNERAKTNSTPHHELLFL